jgi:hypothetical protein
MTPLAITVTGGRPAAQTAAPAIAFRLRIDVGTDRVHAIALRCQTRIEPRRRPYTPDEQARLFELFGAPSQWDKTLQGVTWAHSSIVVPSFEQRIEIDLTVPCTYDLEVASAKYLHAVRTGDIPLAFLFSGTVFTVRDGSVSVEPVPWDLEATFRMPSDVWQAAMHQFFPGGGWVRLSRDTIDRLQQFRGRHAVVTWDEAIDLLLESAASQQPL